MSDAPPPVEWEKILPLAHGARVLAVNSQGLIALEKPEGLMTHPNKEVERNYSLLDAPYDLQREYYHWKPTSPNDPGRLYLLNRLDSPTSGVVLAAVSPDVAAAGRRAFAAGEVKKTYFALVLGRPRPNHGTWTDRLARMRPPSGPPQRGVRMGIGKPGPAQTAVTNFETVESHPNAGAMLTLLRLEPVTGRTHQLRVQCAARRSPIVGDGTYGDFPFNREFARRTGHKRLFLHAAKLRIPHLAFAVESPVPREFYVALGKEGEEKPRGAKI